MGAIEIRVSVARSVLLAVVSMYSTTLPGQTPAGFTAGSGTQMPVIGASTPRESVQDPKLRVRYMSLPLALEVNQGQSDSQVKFLARGQGYELFLTSNQTVLSLAPSRSSHQGSDAVRAAVRTQLIGGNPSPVITAEEELPGTSNYFIGRDPKNWRTNVAQYARVRYRDVYNGIDLVYYGNQQELEYDISVSPGADPTQVRFEVSGVDRLGLSRSGDLVLHSTVGDVIWRKPVIYQETNSSKRLIAGRYRIHSRHEFGFELGEYDHSKTLIIDPVLSYSTFIGGSLDDWFGWMTVDSAGNAYAVGMTQSRNFPRVNPLPGNNSYAGGAHDATIIKLNPTGTALLYSTYLGGNGDDWNRGVMVDSSGNAYVTGYTTSSNFPTVNPYQPFYGGGIDAFVSKIGPTGSTLLYSSYLGGTGDDFGRGIAADNNGNAYIVGYTNSSSNFPILNALQGAYGGGPYDAFVAKLATTQSGAASLEYSTLLGDSGDDEAIAVAIDSSGNVYVAGSTTSTNFPTQNPYQANNRGGNDVFLAEIDSTDTALIFSTYLGGSGDDIAHGLVVDGTGIYVAGGTTSTNFPTHNAVQATNHGQSDAFIAKFDSAGSSLIYSTYYGGSLNEYCLTLAVDHAGRAFLGGMTASTNFPLVSPIQSTYGGYKFDGFVIAFNASGSQALFATYFGGSSFDEIQGIAVDTSGNNVYVAGETYSPNLQVTSGVVQPTYGGGGDAFVGKIQLNVNSAVVTLSVAKLAYGKLVLGATSGAKTVRLTNTGTATLNITSIATSGDFAISAKTCGSTVAVGGSCTVSVEFTPTAIGTRTGALSFTDNASPTTQTVTLTGTGTQISLSPASINFGTVGVGRPSAASSITVKNVGSTIVNFTGFSIGGTNPGDYLIFSNTCGSTLAGGATCTVSIQFKPTITGTRKATLRVADNGGGSPQTSTLTGVGQ